MASLAVSTGVEAFGCVGISFRLKENLENLIDLR